MDLGQTDARIQPDDRRGCVTAEKTLLTADDLEALSAATVDGTRYELVRGELRTMPPVNYEHAQITARLVRELGIHADANQLGDVLAGDPGFTLERSPDTVRAPDVAFFTAARVPHPRPTRGFPELVPDLAAEVVSPSQTAAEIEEKIQMWLEAGVRLVLVLYPSRRSITLRSGVEARVLSEHDTLELGDLLPGFACRVGDLFPD